MDKISREYAKMIKKERDIVYHQINEATDSQNIKSANNLNKTGGNNGKNNQS